MTKALERRVAVAGLSVRDDDGEGITLTGYASTFNEPYDMGWYTESVDAGAFKRTLGMKPDVRLLVNHDGLPLARTASGTLTLDTDSRGLLATARLDPSDPDVAAIAPKMRRGDLNQMSFAFRTVSDVWEDDMTKRTLRELDLSNGDVSVVTYPANPSTSASIRAAGGGNVDAIASALRCLEQRAASPAEIASILTRALGFFTDEDDVEAAVEAANAAPEAAGADLADDEAARAALVALELRRRRLQAL